MNLPLVLLTEASTEPSDGSYATTCSGFAAQFTDSRLPTGISVPPNEGIAASSICKPSAREAAEKLNKLAPVVGSILWI